MISGDPRPEFLARLAGSLGGGWLERRRFVRELEHHLEDCVADLEQAGLREDAAVRDAMARLGDVEAIITAARAARSTRSRSWRRVARVPVAWIAVGAMSIVTLVAAELPQASGAKVPGVAVTTVPRGRVAPADGGQPERGRPSQQPIIRRDRSRPCRCSRELARGRSRS